MVRGIHYAYYSVYAVYAYYTNYVLYTVSVGSMTAWSLLRPTLLDCFVI